MVHAYNSIEDRNGARPGRQRDETQVRSSHGQSWHETKCVPGTGTRRQLALRHRTNGSWDMRNARVLSEIAAHLRDENQSAIADAGGPLEDTQARTGGNG